MKQVVLGLLVGLMLGIGVATVLFRRAPKDSDTAAEASHEAAAEKTSAHPTVQWDAATRVRVGIVVEPVASAEANPEVVGLARVLDPAVITQAWHELNAARATAEASRKELERLKTLFAQGQNASARALETGEAAVQRDAAAVASAEARLRAMVGKSLPSRPDLAALLSRLNQLQAALLRLEIPLGEESLGAPASAWIAPLNEPARRNPVEVLGPAPNLDPLTQGPAYLVLSDQPDLLPGAAFRGGIRLGAKPISGSLVPSAAVVRHEGETFVFVEKSDHEFTRLKVHLAQPLEGGWLVTEGLTNRTPIVVKGAQTLLSAEFHSGESEE